MEHERVNLSMSLQQLDLLAEILSDHHQMWKRTHRVYMGHTVFGLVEDCSDEFEAEWMVEICHELLLKLERQIKLWSPNSVRELPVEDYENVLRYQLGGKDEEIEVYVYDFRGSEYLVFSNARSLESFLRSGDEPLYRFASFAELHTFLKYWRFKKY